METQKQVPFFNNKSNVLYFEDQIDVRLIPKNASTTFKLMWTDFHGYEYKKSKGDNPHGYFPVKWVEENWRTVAVKYNGGLWRKDTTRIAIKRDPVDRWLSTVNFAILMHEYGKYHAFNDLDWTDRDINDLAEQMRDTGIENIEEWEVNEFFSQTYCGGDISQYDHIFYLRDFDKCKALMEEILEQPLLDIESTVTKGKGKWKMKDLTSKAIDDIRVLYKRDYDNGWC